MQLLSSPWQCPVQEQGPLGWLQRKEVAPPQGLGGYNSMSGKGQMQQCHLQLPSQGLRHQEHHCTLLHIAALNLSLSGPPGLALVSVCSWEGSKGWGRGGDAVGHSSPSCPVPGPRATSLLVGKREGAVPRIRKKRGWCMWQGE